MTDNQKTGNSCPEFAEWRLEKMSPIARQDGEFKVRNSEYLREGQSPTEFGVQKSAQSYLRLKIFWDKGKPPQA